MLYNAWNPLILLFMIIIKSILLKTGNKILA